MISKFFWYIIFLGAASIDFLIYLLSLIKKPLDAIMRTLYTTKKLLIVSYKKIQHFSLLSPKKVLIIRTDRLGDAVITTPLIKALREAQSNLKIYILASTRNEKIFVNNPHIEKVFSINVDSWLKYNQPFGFHAFISFFKEQLFDINFRKALIRLKRENIDLSLNLVGSRITTFIGKVISRHCITQDLKGFSYLADYCSEFPFVSVYPKEHIVERYFYLASKGIKGMKGVDPFNYGLELHMCNETSVKKRDSILFHIGGTAYRRVDNYRLLHTIEEISQVVNCKIYIIDDPRNHNIRFFKTILNNHKIHFIEGMDLESLVKFVAENVFLAFASDGGMTHILNALTNTFVYFGSGAVWAWYPWDTSSPMCVKTYQDGTQVWQTEGKYLHRFIFYPIVCAPCYEAGCKHLYCFKPLKAEFFIEQIKEMVKEINKV